MTGYEHGTTVFRDRRPTKANPANPDRPTVGAWPAGRSLEGLDVLELPGCYIAASSTSAVPDAIRTQSTDYRSLYTRDRNIDVRIGDRIRSGDYVYKVDQRPQGDVNPFTGWAPGVEIPLTGVVG